MLNKLAAALETAQMIGEFESITLGISRSYHWKGRFLQWGENIPKDVFAAMKKNGEVTVLLNERKEPHSAVCVDASGTVRESMLN
jgi:hypothetical protein